MAGYVRFMILSGARTGSTMLATALNSSPEIVCFREVFNRHLAAINYGVDGYDSRSAADIASREQEPVAFLHTRIYGGHPEEIRAVGFKFLYRHAFEFDHIAQHLIDSREIRVLHLQRRNAIRSLVSWKLVEMSGSAVQEPGFISRRSLVARLKQAVSDPRWAVQRAYDRIMPGRLRKPRQAITGQSATPPAATVTLTERECRDAIWQQAWGAEHHDKAYRDHAMLTVFYDEIIRNADGTLGRVQEFLGVEPRPLAPTTLHQNPQPLRELIENYDEIREAFRDTEYAWMLEE